MWISTVGRAVSALEKNGKKRKAIRESLNISEVRCSAEWQSLDYSQLAVLTLNRPPRPRLTLRILAYALADVFGLACVAIGATWFVDKKGLFVAGVPASLAEAVACTAGGVAVMVWAVARILREIGKQGPELQARYADYVAHNHPGTPLPPKGD